ncbi:hypothetical protein [Methyloceanibacter sp.]|nr:hypothetical protein [Methyloceanibacter sp.]
MEKVRRGAVKPFAPWAAQGKMAPKLSIDGADISDVSIASQRTIAPIK